MHLSHTPVGSHGQPASHNRTGSNIKSHVPLGSHSQSLSHNRTGSNAVKKSTATTGSPGNATGSSGKPPARLEQKLPRTRSLQDQT